MSSELLSLVHFPMAGIDVSLAFGKQPNRAIYDGTYFRTSADAQNVRAFDPQGRLRGGSRCGLSKYIAGRVPSQRWIIQELRVLTHSGAEMSQFSNSGRVVTLIAISRGTIYAADAGESTWIEATNNTGETPALNLSGLMSSAPNQQKLWIVDGTNAVVYSPITNVVDPWTATAGSFPVDSAGNLPRLTCLWRGRNVLSGLLLDPQNWFMSAVDNPRDFDYSPASSTPTQAVAGNNSPLGTVGDVITALVPYTDDILIFGGDHSIFVMRGDPMAGGQIDMVSSTIGFAWGEAWCVDPYGTVYFCSNRMGVYAMVPGQQPQRISQQIENLLADVDTGENSIRLQWNDRFQGFHMWVTPLSEPAATTHFFYEQRTGAWWKDSFGNDDLNPLCCVTFDGNLPGDRVALIGSWDGYVRAVDPDAEDDDGTPIEGYVVIGPFTTKDMDVLLLKDTVAVLGENSATVDYSVFVGDTAEKALASEAVDLGTWDAGRNDNTFIREAGHAIYIRIDAIGQWAMEQIRLRLQGKGKVRARSIDR